MAVSKKIIINKAYKKKDGSCAIYLQVIIDRKKHIINLNLCWQLRFFEIRAGKCLPRSNDDKDVDDYNMIISDAEAKANEIFKYFRLSKQRITMEKFLKEWNNELSKESVITYMEQKAKKRLKDKEIEYTTYQAHLKVIVKLKAWKKSILFLDMDHNWAGDFDAFLKKHIVSRRNNSTNTRWNHHKTIKSYLRLAKKDHISFEDPYDYFSIAPIQGSWRPVYEADLNKLYTYYKAPNIKENEKLVLRRFLFSAMTGLRKSDLYRVEESWLSKGILRFLPYKNRKLGKILELPIEEIALEMFNDAIREKGKGRRLFDDLKEQPSNRILKRVAKILEIDVNLHHHVARHTFITLYLKNGGTLDMAQEYAGHHDIKQTMKYNHIDEERRRESMKLMNNIIKAS